MCNKCLPCCCNLSLIGPQGPQGPQGPAGPPGPPATASALSGLQTQLVGSGGTTVAVGANVIFNSIVSNPSPNITYNAATGVFTITQPGTYYIDWWVNADGAGPETTVIFSIVASNGQTISASSLSPVTSLQLNGHALITVAAPATFSLVNNTPFAVAYGVSAIQADLAIIQVTA
ncbi:BclA C-terminal domain-containing protein [Marasmitruncus massiliensis]|uniref:BclA C-terminal domain-containing protein n=1 Tax=Marasmitruncus massiliensis TaxID=1944642 RepID=UPI0015E0FF2A|nr:hypothetical protein [Marasmitruncus massiliensis]